MCVCELVLGNFCACEMKEMQYVVTNNFIQPRCSEGAKYASNFEISPFSFMPNIAKFIFHLSSVQMWQIRLYRIWILLQHSILLTLRAQFYAQFVFCRTFHATCVSICCIWSISMDLFTFQWLRKDQVWMHFLGLTPIFHVPFVVEEKGCRVKSIKLKQTVCQCYFRSIVNGFGFLPVLFCIFYWKISDQIWSENVVTVLGTISFSGAAISKFSSSFVFLSIHFSTHKIVVCSNVIINVETPAQLNPLVFCYQL